jgi:hypothetical protein
MLPAESTAYGLAYIFDSKGSLIKEVMVKNASNYSFRVEIRDLMPGSYVIQTRSGKAYQFIKQ